MEGWWKEENGGAKEEREREGGRGRGKREGEEGGGKGSRGSIACYAAVVAVYIHTWRQGQSVSGHMTIFCCMRQLYLVRMQAA